MLCVRMHMQTGTKFIHFYLLVAGIHSGSSIVSSDFILFHLQFRTQPQQDNISKHFCHLCKSPAFATFGLPVINMIGIWSLVPHSTGHCYGNSSFVHVSELHHMRNCCCLLHEMAMYGMLELHFTYKLPTQSSNFGLPHKLISFLLS